MSATTLMTATRVRSKEASSQRGSGERWVRKLSVAALAGATWMLCTLAGGTWMFVQRDRHYPNLGGDIDIMIAAQEGGKLAEEAAKINGIRSDLFYTTGGADTLVVYFATGLFLIGICPFGIHWRRKSCTCTRQARCGKGRERAHG